MKIKILFLLLILNYSFAFAQKSIEDVDLWIQNWPIDDISKKDSMLIWSEMLFDAHKKLNYPRAEAYAFRFKGLFHDYNDQPTEALKNYLDFLEKTKQINNINDELTATGDLVYVYTNTNQHYLAKPLIMKFTSLKNKYSLNQKKLSTFYNNLGIIYRNEGKPDSAIIAYNESLKIKEILNDQKGISTLKINLSALYNYQKNYRESLRLANENLEYLQNNKNVSDLWNNLINKAGALDGLKDHKGSMMALNQALELAQKINSKKLLQINYEQLAVSYSNQSDFVNAYKYLIKSNDLKAELINEETTKKIADLQEKYNADERERQNQLLNAQLESQKNKQISFWIAIFSLLSILSITAVAFVKNQKKNITIQKQNQKLIDLNSEKNELISIVSHDLSSPFTTIKMWLKTLSDNPNTEDLNEAKEMISKTVDSGLNSIKKILTIDKKEMSRLQLEPLDIADFLSEIIKAFAKEAENKQIKIKIKVLQNFETIITDHSLLKRAIENLISNAIKFSNYNSEIHLTSFEENNKWIIEIRDFGQGISKEDLPHIFDKYNQLNSISTANEHSNGLGLSIVKRIAEEIGGEIKVDSTKGKGSTFRFGIRL